MPVHNPNDPYKPAAGGRQSGGLPRARRAPHPLGSPGLEILDDTAGVWGAETAEEPGFEVVEDDPSPPPPLPREKEPVAVVRVVPVKESGARAKTRPARKKKRTKKRVRAYEPEAEDDTAAEADAIVEWGFPIALMVFGLIMMLVAGFRMGRGPSVEGGVSATTMLGITFVFALVKIPLTIVGLMLVGMLIGIEYGTPLNAVRSLAAISLFTDGIAWLGSSFGLWGMLFSYPLAYGAGLALFMILFRLDTWETWISMVGLAVLSFLLKFIVLFLVAVHASKHYQEDAAWGGGARAPRQVAPARQQPPAWNPPPARRRPPPAAVPPPPPIRLPGDPEPPEDGGNG